MAELLSAAQMRAIERAAIDSGKVTGLELMERAGRGVVEAVFEQWPALAQTPHRAVVLCGPGNNGGDGFVVARLLKDWGWKVQVFLYGDPEKLPPDAKGNCDRWREIGAVSSWNDSAIEDCLDESGHDLVVDALFGTGLTRPMPADTERSWHGFMPRVFAEAPQDRPKYVAVDIPSGLCSDSGRNLEGAFPTDLTVTFHRAKLGHHLCPEGPPQGGSPWCGKLVIKDIGLGTGTDAQAVRLAAPATSWVRKTGGRHKYRHGHALILAGGPGKGGAARLAARGALRIGAGLVTIACPLRAAAEHAAQLNAIMLAPIDGPPGLVEMLEDGRINALCLGPGLGLGKQTHDFVMAALASEAKLVLDADALSRFEARPEVLLDALHDCVVLTPHHGEFARLFPDIAEKLAAPAVSGPAYSKVDATREAARRAGCVVMFKGPDTVIADPSGRCALNCASYDRAAPWLATAGSGDVLAGFVTGLLARGIEPMAAAETAAWLHVECARQFGPGLIAEDIPEVLPQVLRDCLRQSD